MPSDCELKMDTIDLFVSSLCLSDSKNVHGDFIAFNGIITQNKHLQAKGLIPCGRFVYLDVD